MIISFCWDFIIDELISNDSDPALLADERSEVWE